MLIMYYCAGERCNRTYLRSDDRGLGGSAFCPKCGRPMIYVMEFTKWSGLSEEEREACIRHAAGQQPYLDLERRTIIQQQEEQQREMAPKKYSALVRENAQLHSERARLRRMLAYYEKLHHTWKHTANTYHDALWAVLLKYEPDKYSAFRAKCKVKNGEIDLESLPKLK